VQFLVDLVHDNSGPVALGQSFTKSIKAMPITRAVGGGVAIQYAESEVKDLLLFVKVK